MSGLTDKISGEAKDVAGKVTDNKKLQAEGKLQKARGDVKDAAGKVADKLHK
jgi:uncharacterized protein YjbJ (UPF0337 family)